MLACLPMYDRPEVRDATDRYWQAIREALGEGPDELTRDRDLWEVWQSPKLLLSQTCGYPYRARLHGKVSLVGTPDNGQPGCGPGEYNSVFVVRANDPRDKLRDFTDARFAFNEPLSQSGWAAPQNAAHAEGFAFTNVMQTGAHDQSARAVAENRADIAALDSLTWQMIQRHDVIAVGLKELGRTRPTPTLPYITAISRDPVPIFAAITAAIEALAPEDRDALSLRGLVRIPAERYLCVPNPPPPNC